jgi:hypothetical protein
VVILQDDFSGDLKANWKIWGEAPLPKVDTALGTRYLSLSNFSSDLAKQSGVSSQTLITLTQRTKVQFNAQVPDTLAQGTLMFQWNPSDQIRQPVDRLGVISLEIRRLKATLRVLVTGSTCTLDFNSPGLHTYLLRVNDNFSMDLIVDGEPAKSCHAPSIGLAPMGGRISFSGAGWVDDVSVVKE